MDDDSNVGSSQQSLDAGNTPPKQLSSAVNAQIRALASGGNGPYRPSIDAGAPSYRPSISVAARYRPSMVPGFLPGSNLLGSPKPNAIKPSHFLPTGTILAKNAYCETSLVSEKASQAILVMKRINKKFISKRTLRDSFDREVDALLRLDHPNIIKMMHKLEDPEYIYLISEYASKGNFLNLLRERIRMTEEEAFNSFIACCFALNHLVQNNISIRALNLEKVHRNGEQVKLSPFSFQDFIKSNEEDDIPLEDGEISRDEEDDVSSEKAVLMKLGKLLLELISGRASIHSSTNKSTFENMRNTPYFQRLNISDSCKTLLEQLLSSEANEITCISDVLQSEWAGSFSRPAQADPFGLGQLADANRNMNSLGQVPRTSISKSVPRGSYFQAPPENIMGSGTSLRLQSSNGAGSNLKNLDNKSTNKKNYWRKKKGGAENADISMSSSRFFEQNKELERSKAERVKKFTVIEKSLMEKIAEIFGCTTR
jgi:serine/threonine protein kinase